PGRAPARLLGNHVDPRRRLAARPQSGADDGDGPSGPAAQARPGGGAREGALVIPLQLAVLALVATAGGLVCVTRDPFRQLVVNGIFGIGLIVAFVVFQAPDVALSAISVATIAFPLLVLVALAQVRK